MQGKNLFELAKFTEDDILRAEKFIQGTEFPDIGEIDEPLGTAMLVIAEELKVKNRLTDSVITIASTLLIGAAIYQLLLNVKERID